MSAKKVALVIGGSRGIGRAIVEQLVEDGWQVAFTYVTDPARADELVRSLSGAASAFHFDLADRARPNALIREVEERHGPLDVFVHCAGIRRDGLLAMTSDTDLDAILDADLSAPLRCCRAVLPGMLRRRTGGIVLLSSLAALQGVAGQATYSAAKAGLLGLTRSLAREVGKRNVRVNAVVAGYVPTDFVADLTPEQVARLRSPECLPTGVTAASVAATVAFLLAERAASITGQTFVVDAGTTA